MALNSSAASLEYAELRYLAARHRAKIAMISRRMMKTNSLIISSRSRRRQEARGRQL